VTNYLIDLQLALITTLMVAHFVAIIYRRANRPS
jgi:hypothetical protein